MGLEGDYRPPGDGITRKDNTITCDVLYFDGGVLAETNSGDIVQWCLPWVEKLIGDTARNQIEVVISHNFESNAITSNINGRENVGIFDQLHAMADHLGMEASQVTFINGNFKLWKHYDHWKELTGITGTSLNLKCAFKMMSFYSPWTFNNYPGAHPEDPSWVNLTHMPIDENRPMEKVYNCLNRVPRAHRMSLFKRLAEHRLLHYGLVSFNEKPPYGCAGLDNDIMSEELHSKLPIYLEFNPEDDYANVNDWILTKINRHQYEPTDNSNNKHINHFDDIINNSFITVVPETEYGEPQGLYYNNLHSDPIDNTTYLSYHNGFITEKTFRHIRDGHPMLWVSAPYTIDMLHYLGFKTFAPYIDESYDRELDPIKRMDMVGLELKRICNLSQEERVSMYKQLIPVLQHNQQHLLDMKEIPLLTRKDWNKYSQGWEFRNQPADDGIMHQ